MSKTANHIILYDGFCELCNKSIRFIIRNKTLVNFTYLPLQSEKGKDLLSKHHIDNSKINSFVYINNHSAYIESTAVLMVFKQIKKLKWMSAFLYLPKIFRDIIYRIIAKYRYKWFGKNEECYLP